MIPEPLDQYRASISEIDEQIIKLVHKRLVFSKSIAAIKTAQKRPIKDEAQEKRIFQKNIDVGKTYHLEKNFCIQLSQLLINKSIEFQSKNHKISNEPASTTPNLDFGSTEDHSSFDNCV